MRVGNEKRSTGESILSVPDPAHADSPVLKPAAANLLVVVLDAQGVILHVNRACEEMTGWSADELRGRPIWDTLLATVTASAVRDHVSAVCRGGAASPSPAAAATSPEAVGQWSMRAGGRLDVAWSMAALPGPTPAAVVVGFNVDAQSAPDRQVREGDATFRILAQTTTAAIFIHRGERVFDVNPAAEAITGYSRGELLAMDFWQIVHPSMRDVACAQGAARLRGEPVPTRSEVKIVTKSGEERWIEFAAARVQHGGELAVVGTAFDVTDRHRAAREERARERRFRALIEHSSDIVSITAADGTLTYVGPSITRILGYRPDEVEGRNVFDFVHDDDRDAMEQAIHGCLDTPGAPVTVLARLRHRDGGWRWTEGVGTNLLGEPTINGIIVNARDVTDRRRAEDLLRESEQRFALAVEGARDGIFEYDVRADALYASPRLREILEVDADAVLRITDLFRQRIHPEEVDSVHQRWQAYLTSNVRQFRAEYRLLASDGTYRWIETRGVTVRDADGSPQRMIGSLTDVTQRKRAEEEARQRQAELAHVLRVTAMGEMAAGLAHELNQPLSAIVNYARGCARRLADVNAPPDLLDVLDRIANEALRAGEVVRGLKRVVRKEPPGTSQIDLNEVARDAIALVRGEARERQILMRLESAAQLPPLHADRVQIEQVILNLLRNAVDAISKPPGIVSLRLEAIEGRAVRVAIADTGDGIPPELGERIFAPFFTTKISGLGMGLSISRTIIEAHGGRLWADANAGAGSTFSFTLPLDEEFVSLGTA